MKKPNLTGVTIVFIGTLIAYRSTDSGESLLALVSIIVGYHLLQNEFSNNFTKARNFAAISFIANVFTSRFFLLAYVIFSIFYILSIFYFLKGIEEIAKIEGQKKLVTSLSRISSIYLVALSISFFNSIFSYLDFMAFSFSVIGIITDVLMVLIWINIYRIVLKVDNRVIYRKRI